MICTIPQFIFINVKTFKICLHAHHNSCTDLINRYFRLFREAIFKSSLTALEKEVGIFEADESYFGARRVRGRKGRGAIGKTPVFGLLKRNGKVFVSLVANCSKEELLPIIQGKVLEGSTIYTDGWKAYDGLILNGYDHYRISHSKNEFAILDPFFYYLA